MPPRLRSQMHVMLPKLRVEEQNRNEKTFATLAQKPGDDGRGPPGKKSPLPEANDQLFPG